MKLESSAPLRIDCRRLLGQFNVATVRRFDNKRRARVSCREAQVDAGCFSRIYSHRRESAVVPVKMNRLFVSETD